MRPTLSVSLSSSFSCTFTLDHPQAADQSLLFFLDSRSLTCVKAFSSSCVACYLCVLGAMQNDACVGSGLLCDITTFSFHPVSIHVMWSMHVEYTCGVYILSIHVMWSIYIEHTYGVSCGVYIWSIHVEYTYGVSCGVYILSIHMEYTCGVYIWRIHVSMIRLIELTGVSTGQKHDNGRRWDGHDKQQGVRRQGEEVS